MARRKVGPIRSSVSGAQGQDNADDQLIDINQVRRQAQSFYDRNQKIILIVGIGLLVIVGGFFGYKNLYQKPRQNQAVEQMFHAQALFEMDSFAAALTNPGGGNEGFIGIIDNYGGTPSANLAKYYAGVCYLNMKQYDEALKYMKDFSPAGKITPTMKNALLGDIYSEKNDFKSALDYYKKAAFDLDNESISPFMLKKYGMLCEKEGNMKEAVNAYKIIMDKYPNTMEGREIEKYLARAEAQGAGK